MEKVFLGLSLFSHCPTLLLIVSKFSNLPLIKSVFPMTVIGSVFISLSLSQPMSFYIFSSPHIDGE